MDQLYLSYLDLLDELRRSLEQLAELARKKIDAVRADDLLALDGILKQEQALALALRGQEQKRRQQLEQLGLGDVRLADLPGRYPSHLYLRAKEAAEGLQRQYKVYQGTADVARNTLECNLHEIEKQLVKAGGGAMAGPGYAAPDLAPARIDEDGFPRLTGRAAALSRQF